MYNPIIIPHDFKRRKKKKERKKKSTIIEIYDLIKNWRRSKVRSHGSMKFDCLARFARARGMLNSAVCCASTPLVSGWKRFHSLSNVPFILVSKEIWITMSMKKGTFFWNARAKSWNELLGVQCSRWKHFRERKRERESESESESAKRENARARERTR